MTRRAAVVKVQIARRDLGLAEDDYRSILERLTGKTSSSACSDAELGKVLDEFKAKGWAPKVKTPAKSAKCGGRQGTIVIDEFFGRSIPNRPADHPAAKKARALWISLWNLGEVRDSSEVALEAFARRQLGVERLQWADQALVYKLIEALKAMAERAGWSQDTSGYPRGTDLVRVLKANLVRAQCRRRGEPVPDFRGVTTAQLDAWIQRDGFGIRASIEAAG